MQREFDVKNVISICAMFYCPNCKNYLQSEFVGTPTPDLSAEKASGSFTHNYGYAECFVCENEFQVDVYAGWNVGYVEIEDLHDEYEVEFEFEENDSDYLEAILDNTEFYNNFETSILNIEKLNMISLEDNKVSNMQKRLLYISVITCLETYLSDAFINTTLGNEKFLKKFVKTFRDFKNMKFDIGEIYDRFEKINETASVAMIGVIYHNLAKIKGMYKDTLDVNFSDISELMKAVKIRHDLVHRNGKTKEGKKIVISKSDVIELIGNVKEFVEEIETQVHRKMNT